MIDVRKEYEKRLDSKSQQPKKIHKKHKVVYKRKTLQDFLNTEENKNYIMDMIHTNLEELDYEKIHETMVKLDWGWAMEDGLRIPSISEIKNNLKNLIFDLFEHDESYYRISTGGFTVLYIIHETDENGKPYTKAEDAVDLQIYFSVEDNVVIMS